MKKLLALLASALMVTSLSACGSNDDHQAAGDTSAASGAKQTFTVGFDADFPPYGYQEDGEYVGFDLDLAAEVAKRQGWELVKQPIDWDSKDMELDSGTIDCLWNGFSTTGREGNYTFSEPYVDNAIVYVVKADSGINTPADLAGKNVVVQADSSGLSALKTDEGKKVADTFGSLTEVPEYNSAFMNLESGAADVVVVDTGVADFQIESRAPGTFKVLDENLVDDYYAVGFKLGNTELRDKVQESLDEIYADGTFMELAKKYGLENSVITK